MGLVSPFGLRSRVLGEVHRVGWGEVGWEGRGCPRRHCRGGKRLRGHLEAGAADS